MAFSAFADGDSVSKTDSDCKVAILFDNVELLEVSLMLFAVSLMVKQPPVGEVNIGGKFCSGEKIFSSKKIEQFFGVSSFTTSWGVN